MATPLGAPGAAGGSFRVAALVLFAIWMVLFAPQLFAGRVFLSGDWPVYLPFSEFSAERWHALHQRTFWNPYVFCGLPAAASLADSRPQYLPAFLLDAVGMLDRLPWWPPLVLPLLAHLAGMLAAARLARSLWSVGTWAMVWAGAAWGLMPNLVVPFAYGHHAQLVTAGLMPVALLAIHALFTAADARGAARAALGLALVVGIQTIAGHPQFVYYSALLSGVFALERAWRSRRPARLGLALAAVLMGSAMAAATWWPMTVYGMDSIRGREGGVLLMEVRRYSIALRDLAIFVWPRAMGFGGRTYWGGMQGTDFPQYFGILVIFLIAFAWRGVGTRRDGAALMLAGAALLAVVLSVGAHLGGVYAVVHDSFPLWSRFRVAVAMLIVAQLAGALLSARGFDRALKGMTSRGRRVLTVAAISSMLLAAALTLAPGGFERAYERVALGARGGFTAEQARQAAPAARADLAGQLLLAGGAMLLLAWGGAARRGARLVAPAMVLLLVVDLGKVSMPALRAATGRRDRLVPPPPSLIARRTASEPRSRASCQWPEGLLYDNRWVSWRTPWVGGAHGALPRLWGQMVAWQLTGLPAVQRSLAVRYVSALPGHTPNPAEYERVGMDESGLAVWRLRGGFPRAYAVPEVQAPGNDIAVALAMSRVDSFPARVAFAAEEAAAGRYPGSLGCSIRWVEDSPDRITLETEASDRAFVVVADAYFAGWQARMDDEPAPIFRVNHMLRGVIVPAGRHRMTMSYLPAGWASAVAVSRAALAVWLVLLAGTTVRRARRGSA